MFMPSRMFMIKYKQKYLGHLAEKKSIVFGFVKNNHVNTVRKYLKFDGMTTKLNDYTYTLSAQKMSLKRPIDLRQMQIIECDPLETCIELELNNVELKLVDEVIPGENQLKLISNFTMNVDIDISVKLEKLDATFEGREFRILDEINSDDIE
jgi:hypothetical protein